MHKHNLVLNARLPISIHRISISIFIRTTLAVLSRNPIPVVVLAIRICLVTTFRIPILIAVLASILILTTSARCQRFLTLRLLPLFGLVRVLTLLHFPFLPFLLLSKCLPQLKYLLLLLPLLEPLLALIQLLPSMTSTLIVDDVMGGAGSGARLWGAVVGLAVEGRFLDSAAAC